MPTHAGSLLARAAVALLVLVGLLAYACRGERLPAATVVGADAEIKATTGTYDWTVDGTRTIGDAFGIPTPLEPESIGAGAFTFETNDAMIRIFKDIGAHVVRHDEGVLALDMPVPRSADELPDNPTGRAFRALVRARAGS